MAKMGELICWHRIVCMVNEAAQKRRQLTGLMAALRQIDSAKLKVSLVVFSRCAPGSLCVIAATCKQVIRTRSQPQKLYAGTTPCDAGNQIGSTGGGARQEP